MSSLSSLFVLITPQEVIADFNPIADSSKLPQVTLQISTLSDVELNLADCSYSYQGGTMDAQFDLTQLADHLICPGDSLLNKIQLYYLTLTEEHRQEIIQNSPYPGSSDIDRFVNTFVGGYVTILFTAYLLSLKQNLIGEPFSPLDPIFPMINVDYTIVSQSLCAYLGWYTTALKGLNKRKSRMMKSLGAVLLMQSDDFCCGYITCLPKRSPQESVEDGKIYCFDEQVAIFAATISFSCDFESRLTTINEQVESIEQRVDDGIARIRSSVSSSRRSVDRQIDDIRETQRNVMSTANNQLDQMLNRLETRVQQLTSDIADQEKAWNDSCDMQLNRCIDRINKVIANEVKQMEKVVECHRKTMIDQRGKTIRDVTGHRDEVLRYLKDKRQEMINKVNDGLKALDHRMVGETQTFDAYLQDLVIQVQRVIDQKTEEIKDRARINLEHMWGTRDNLIAELQGLPEITSVADRFTMLEQRLDAFEESRAYHISDDAIRLFESQANKICRKLHDQYFRTYEQAYKQALKQNN